MYQNFLISQDVLTNYDFKDLKSSQNSLKNDNIIFAPKVNIKLLFIKIK